MATTLTNESLLKGIRLAIQHEADRLREEFIEKAVADYEKELRERVLREAVSVAHFYSIDTRNGEIVITVRHS